MFQSDNNGQISGIGETPFMYRAIQQPMAPPTGNAMADMLMTMLAPLLANMSGMRQPQFLPRLGPGVSPWDAFYGRDVTTPLYNQGQQEFLTHMGGIMGSQLGAIGNNIGLNRLMGLSANSFSSNLTNFGQGGVGAFLTSAVLQTQTAQSILGANPMDLYNQLFRVKNQLVETGGMPMHPLDIQGQTFATQHATNVSNLLTQNMLAKDPKTGAMLLTPNYAFTRGFGTEMGDIVSTMATRDIGGIRGEIASIYSDTSTDMPTRQARAANVTVSRIGEMTRMLEAVGNAMGGGTVNELTAALDQLVGINWPKMDVGSLERSFREISAMAKVLNVTSRGMLETMTTVQGSVGASMGISSGARMLGVTAGGYESLDVTKMITTPILLQGAGDPVRTQQALAQQTALMHIGYQSPMGMDAQHLAYLAQTGQISEAAYGNFMGAVQGGTIDQAKTMADLALRQAYGSESRGREIFNDPALRQMIRQQTSPGFAADATQAIMTFQHREMGQRVSRNLLDQETRIWDTFRSEAGMGPALDPEAVALAQFDATFEYLAKHDTGLASAAEEMFTRNRMVGDTALQAMSKLEGVIAGDPAFRQHRDALFRAQSAAADTVANEMTAAESEKLADQRVRLKQMDSLSTGYRLSDDQTKSIKAIQELDSQGKHGDAETQWSKLRSTLAPAQIAHLDRTAAAERMVIGHELERGGATATARNILNRGLGIGQGVTEIVQQQADVVSILDQVSRGQLPPDAAINLLTQMPNIDPSIIAAVRDSTQVDLETGATIYSGQVTAVKSAQIKTYNALRNSAAQVASERGVAGIEGAIHERRSKSDIGKSMSVEARALAAQDEIMSDLWADLRTTFPQLVVERISGKITTARMFGLQDTFDAVPDSLKAQVDELETSRGDLEKSLTAISGLSSIAELKDAGINTAALEAAKKMSASLVSTEGLTDTKYGEIVGEVQQQMITAGISAENRDVVVKHLDTYRTKIESTETLTRGIKTTLGKLSQEDKDRMALDKKLEKRRQDQRDQEQQVVFGQLDVEDHGGLFAVDIELLGEWSWRGEKEKGRLKKINELTETVLGEDAAKKLGTRARLDQIALLTPEVVKNLEPAQREALAQLGEFKLKQDKKISEDEKSAKKGGKGDGIELTGTLILYDKSGTAIGKVPDLRRK